MSSIYQQTYQVIIWMSFNWTEKRDDAEHAIKNFVQLQRKDANFKQRFKLS